MNGQRRACVQVGASDRCETRANKGRENEKKEKRRRQREREKERINEADERKSMKAIRETERRRGGSIRFCVVQRPRNYNGRAGRSFDNDFLNAGLRR